MRPCRSAAFPPISARPGLGAGHAWFAENGLYLDAQGRLTWFDKSLHSNTLNRSIESGNAGFGYALSLEAGQQFAIDDNWSVTPQAQISYLHVGFTDFVDPSGSTVSLDQGDSLVGRIGVFADYEGEWRDTNGQTGSTHHYGTANLSYELLDGTSTSIGSSGVSSKNDPLWGGLGLGGSLNWADDRLSLFGEVGLNSSLNNLVTSYSLGVTAGLKGKF